MPPLRFPTATRAPKAVTGALCLLRLRHLSRNRSAQRQSWGDVRKHADLAWLLAPGQYLTQVLQVPASLGLRGRRGAMRRLPHWPALRSLPRERIPCLRAWFLKRCVLTAWLSHDGSQLRLHALSDFELGPGWSRRPICDRRHLWSRIPLLVTTKSCAQARSFDLQTGRSRGKKSTRLLRKSRC